MVISILVGIILFNHISLIYIYFVYYILYLLMGILWRRYISSKLRSIKRLLLTNTRRVQSNIKYIYNTTKSNSIIDVPRLTIANEVMRLIHNYREYYRRWRLRLSRSVQESLYNFISIRSISTLHWSIDVIMYLLYTYSFNI